MPESTWGFFLDCDEIVEFVSQFPVKDIESDLYLVCLTDLEFLYTRRFLFKLSIDFYWEGPIHEFIKSTGPAISVTYLENIRVIFRRLGASWKSNIEKKYLTYAEKLIQYINEGNRSFRWLLYVGDSFSTAADASKFGDKRRKWLLEAQKYYEEAASTNPQQQSDKYIVNDRLAKLKSL
jgi:hypothetical protein